ERMMPGVAANCISTKYGLFASVHERDGTQTGRLSALAALVRPRRRIGRWRRLQRGEGSIAERKLRRLHVIHLLPIEPESRRDHPGHQRDVVRAFAVENAVPARFPELREGPAEGARVLRRIPDRTPDEDFLAALGRFPERKAVAV